MIPGTWCYTSSPLWKFNSGCVLLHSFECENVKVLVAQSCLTLCDPMDCSSPGSSVCEILQARMQTWVAILFSRRSSRCTDWTGVSCIAGRFFTIWAAREVPFNTCYCQVTSVMSDSVQPHKRQPTRLPHPWDSPGKNTGVGCHFLLQCTKVKSESEVAQSCPTLSDPMDCSPPGSSIHGIFQARVLEWVAFSRWIQMRSSFSFAQHF